ncbi:hypothetical protein JJ691_52360 [Kutzneria sp. CA-103260]|nr:hypothetical protein JJ691_52360 [Kutzneria sp. CA-103260]
MSEHASHFSTSAKDLRHRPQLQVTELDNAVITDRAFAEL